MVEDEHEAGNEWGPPFPTVGCLATRSRLVRGKGPHLDATPTPSRERQPVAIRGRSSSKSEKDNRDGLYVPLVRDDAGRCFAPFFMLFPRSRAGMPGPWPARRRDAALAIHALPEESASQTTEPIKSAK